MGTLSSILRRLRSMPPKKLSAKISKVADHTPLRPEYDGAFPSNRSLADEIHYPHRKRKDDIAYSNTAEVFDQSSEWTSGMGHDAEVAATNVLRILHALKKRGVTGSPPRSRR